MPDPCHLKWAHPPSQNTQLNMVIDVFRSYRPCLPCRQTHLLLLMMSDLSSEPSKGAKWSDQVIKHPPTPSTAPGHLLSLSSWTSTTLSSQSSENKSATPLESSSIPLSSPLLLSSSSLEEHLWNSFSMQMQITTELSVFLSEWRLQEVLAIVKVKWILGICKFPLQENGRRWCWNNTGNLYNVGQLLIHFNKEWYIPQVLLLFFIMVLKEPIDSLAVGWVCAGFDAFLSSGAHVELSVQSWYFYLLQGLPPYPKHSTCWPLQSFTTSRLVCRVDIAQGYRFEFGAHDGRKKTGTGFGIHRIGHFKNEWTSTHAFEYHALSHICCYIIQGVQDGTG